MTDKNDSPEFNPNNIGTSAESYQRGSLPHLESCGDFDMRIARDGTWFYRGSPIGRKALVKLFSTVLQRDEQGDFWLVTPVERGRILVDDAPFTAVELDVIDPGPEQVLKLRTNVDDWVTVDAEHPIRVVEADDTGEPSPYVLVRGKLEALIVRSVFYQLVALATEGEDKDVGSLGLWSMGNFFPLGRAD